MVNWFPLTSKIYTDKKLLDLTISAKVLFVFLVSESNLNQAIGNEQFYIPDKMLSMLLDRSIKTVRRARKDLKGKGLIEYREGFKNKKGRNVATTYKNIKYSTQDKCPGVEGHSNYTRVPRFSFRQMLKIFDIKEVWVWVTLWWWKHEHANPDFFITKKNLKKFTGYKQAVKKVGVLSSKKIFSSVSSDGTLFKVEDVYHKLEFKDWVQWEEPSEGNNKDNFWEDMKDKLDKKISGKKKQKQKEVLNYFKDKCYSKSIQYNTREQLNPLIEKYGVNKIKEVIKQYAEADILSKPTGTDKKTFARLMGLIREGYFNISA